MTPEQVGPMILACVRCQYLPGSDAQLGEICVVCTIEGYRMCRVVPASTPTRAATEISPDDAAFVDSRRYSSVPPMPEDEFRLIGIIDKLDRPSSSPSSTTAPPLSEEEIEAIREVATHATSAEPRKRKMAWAVIDRFSALPSSRALSETGDDVIVRAIRDDLEHVAMSDVMRHRLTMLLGVIDRLSERLAKVIARKDSQRRHAEELSRHSCGLNDFDPRFRSICSVCGGNTRLDRLTGAPNV